MECLECFDSLDSKTTWFYVCKNKSCTVATIMAKHAEIFC